MAENLQIRLADPKEADRLAEIEAICFPPAEAASHEDVVNRMGAFPENFVVAVKDDQIVGFINGGTTDKPVLPDEFYHDITLHKKDGEIQTVFGLNVILQSPEDVIPGSHSDRIRAECDPGIPSSGDCRRTCGILQGSCERTWKKSSDPYLQGTYDPIL